MDTGLLLANRYGLEELLGRGGMGEVWRATDRVLNRTVAVKLLLPGIDGVAAERFRREGRIAARLHHPNVVAVYDHGAHDDRLFLVMEFVDGRSLAEELAAYGVLAPERVAGIAGQVADGLARARQQSVVHRDIKPGNLMLAADGTVKIADFGIAHLADDVAAALTTTGEVMGTTTYLAPERAQGRPTVAASDVYSLGCVLYELLTGQPPFRADSVAGTIYQHISATPTPLPALRPEVPGAVGDYVLRLLAKEPDTRPTAAEVADWFKNRASSGTSWQPAAMPPAVNRTARLAVPSLPSMPPARRRGRARVLAGVVGAAAVGTVAVVGMTADDGEWKQPARQTAPASPTPTPSESAASAPTRPPTSAQPTGTTHTPEVERRSSTAPVPAPAKKTAEKKTKQKKGRH